MKQSSVIALVVCLASALGFTAANAQSGANLRVKLPYAVTFGNVTLPAGDCSLIETKDNGHESFFVIRSAAGRAVDVMLERDSAFDSPNSDASSVDLRRVGDKYEIAGLRVEGRGYRVY